MLVLTPVSVPQSGYYHRPSYYHSMVPAFDVDMLMEQVAYDYAVAHACAKAEAARRAAQRREAEERAFRQALLALANEDAYYYRRPVHHFEAPYRRSAPIHEVISFLSNEVRVRNQRREQAAYGRVAAACTPRVATRPSRPQAYPFEQQQSQRTSQHPGVRPSSRWAPDQHVPRERPAPLQDLLQGRLRHESDPEVREMLEKIMSRVSSQQAPVDLKGKGKAKEITTPTGQQQPSGDLQKLMTEFYNALQEVTRTPSDESDTSRILVFENAGQRAASEPAPFTSTHQQAKPSTSSSSAKDQSQSADLRRKPALPPKIADKLIEIYKAKRTRKLSLGQIADIESTLRSLEASFVFPPQLDFDFPLASPTTPNEHGLAYTPNNTPVHLYEHALNELLTRLDAVESAGDEEVRGRRREVVKEVERALKDMERRVEESHERSRERARTPVSAPEADNVTVELTPAEPEAAVAEAHQPVATAESEPSQQQGEAQQTITDPDSEGSPAADAIPVEAATAVELQLPSSTQAPADDLVAAPQEAPSNFVDTSTQDEPSPAEASSADVPAEAVSSASEPAVAPPEPSDPALLPASTMFFTHLAVDVAPSSVSEELAEADHLDVSPSSSPSDLTPSQLLSVPADASEHVPALLDVYAEAAAPGIRASHMQSPSVVAEAQSHEAEVLASQSPTSLDAPTHPELGTPSDAQSSPSEASYTPQPSVDAEIPRVGSPSSVANTSDDYVFDSTSDTFLLRSPEEPPRKPRNSDDSGDEGIEVIQPEAARPTSPAAASTLGSVSVEDWEDVEEDFII